MDAKIEIISREDILEAFRLLINRYRKAVPGANLDAEKAIYEAIKTEFEREKLADRINAYERLKHDADYIIMQDGNMWCCVKGDFEDLQMSDAWFGRTPEEAFRLARAEPVCGVKEGEEHEMDKEEMKEYITGLQGGLPRICLEFGITDLAQLQLVAENNETYFDSLIKIIHKRLEKDSAELLSLRAQVEKQKWKSIKEGLPESGKYVFAFFVKTNLVGRYPTIIRAFYAAPNDVEQPEEDDCSEYDEASDTYYLPEGWYECNETEEGHYKVHENISHWRLLPEPPQVEREEEATK